MDGRGYVGDRSDTTTHHRWTSTRTYLHEHMPAGGETVGLAGLLPPPHYPGGWLWIATWTVSQNLLY